MSDELKTLLRRMRAASVFVDPPGALTPLLDALEAVLELHRRVEVEPSATLCDECSFQLPNGRYFGKVVEWPCPTVTALHAVLTGGNDE